MSKALDNLKKFNLKSCADPRVVTLDLWITPEYAAHLLRVSTTVNRNERKLSIQHYMKDMKNGLWVLNYEGAMIDDDENILQGHHRFHACVEAGVPFKCRLVIGVDPSVMKTLDNHSKRDLRDVLKMQGYEESSALAPMARALMLIEGGRLADGNCPFTRVEQDAWVAARPDLVESAAFSSVRKLRGFAPSLVGALHYMWKKVESKRAAEDFLEPILYSQCFPCTMSFVLWKKLNDAKENGRTIGDRELLMFAVKAWNAQMAGRLLTRLTWNEQTEGVLKIRNSKGREFDYAEILVS